MTQKLIGLILVLAGLGGVVGVVSRFTHPNHPGIVDAVALGPGTLAMQLLLGVGVALAGLWLVFVKSNRTRRLASGERA
ncbi:hypothetical protein WCE59_13395 [Luteimonas sp. MJ146]